MNIVHFGGILLNNFATSKEELLDISVKLAKEKGINSINIREIARLGNISVGCVYNYFPSKATLITATVGKIWENIFHQTKETSTPPGFKVSVKWIFDSLLLSSKEYPSFFSSHAISFSKDHIGEGRMMMNCFFEHLKKGLLEALEKDLEVKKEVFSESFKKEDFIDFVFDNLIMLSMKKASSCKLLLTIIEKSIY